MGEDMCSRRSAHRASEPPWPAFMPLPGTEVASALAGTPSLNAVLVTAPATPLTIALTARHALSGLRLQRSVSLRFNFPPRGPAAPLAVDAPPGPLVAHVATVTLSTDAASWVPFLSTGAPLVVSPFPSGPLPQTEMWSMALHLRFQGRCTGRKRQAVYNEAQTLRSTLFLSTPAARPLLGGEGGGLGAPTNFFWGGVAERGTKGHTLISSIQMPEILPPSISKGGGRAVHVHKAQPPPPPMSERFAGTL